METETYPLRPDSLSLRSIETNIIVIWQFRLKIPLILTKGLNINIPNHLKTCQSLSKAKSMVQAQTFQNKVNLLQPIRIKVWDKVR